MNKNMIILSLAVVIISAAIVIGITALPSESQDPVNLPTVHEWVRDRALDSLEIMHPRTWSTQDTTPEGLIGTSIKTYTSEDLTVTVSHNLNPKAAFSVTVQNSENTWSLWVNQDGTTQPQ